ncbi:hypothetical protein [Picosynechococcus sp. NKBG15041c]|nr:hypothetical protein [Picosynechococcus sp. NKBG15041c]
MESFGLWQVQGSTTATRFYSTTGTSGTWASTHEIIPAARSVAALM